MNKIIDRADLLPLLLVTLLAAVACFLFLNRGPLYYDEAIYAQVAKEITQTGDWITLHWNGRPWFHKPPLYLWSTALLFQVFGPSELLARFTSALAGVGCVALTYLIAKRVANNTTATLAALILLSSALFTVNARQGMTDVLMTLFTLVAVYAYLSTGPEGVRWIITGLACALAVLTKGAAGLLAPMIVVVSLVWDRRWRDLTSPSVWYGLIVFLVLAGSWHILLFALHGRAFLNAYLFKHVIERASADLHQYHYGYAFYFGALWHFVWPWVLFIPFAVVAAVRRSGPKIVLVNAILPLLLFTLAQTKFSWYIVPIIPALAILTAQFLCEMMMRVRARYRPLIWLTVLLFAVVGSVEVVNNSKTETEINATAELSRRAANDVGAISSSPESLEMTVLYYSNRRLCADPIISPLSFGPETECEPSDVHHFIFKSDKKALIESRFGPVRILAESDGISYGEVRMP